MQISFHSKQAMEEHENRRLTRPPLTHSALLFEMDEMDPLLMHPVLALGNGLVLARKIREASKSVHSVPVCGSWTAEVRV